MNTSLLPRLQASALEADDPADDFDYKDVYFPDLGSEQVVIPLATTAFQVAGYEVRRPRKRPIPPFTFSSCNV